MFSLKEPKPIAEMDTNELRSLIGYHQYRAYEVFTQYAKQEHLRMADKYAGEVARRENFHADCVV